MDWILIVLELAELRKRAETAWRMLSDCTICPRECHVNRLRGEAGVCKTGELPLVSSHNLHFGEEPPISGHRGSGTIFFANCNLRCLYCQNYPISQMGSGEVTSLETLATMMLELEKAGAHNINFVTPTHVVAQILKALLLARKKGLALPIVYNSSGYDALDTLKLLDGIVEIYMPDMRYGENQPASRFSGVKDYVEVNQTAITEMHRQVGDLVVDKDGVATKGLLIRHLVLPNGLSGSKKIFDFLGKEVSKNSYVGLMSQYFPAYQAPDIKEICRRVNRSEFRQVKRWFFEAGLSKGYIQPEPLY
ncbi:MAG: radical SAM protein [candidate division Zixibacteria bacterium DG_27]|nr:MAG: radical SAM protein [candidate division Zixibacteria bacterium DG_27]